MAFTDNFNRADENLEASGNWTHDAAITGALAIVSNQLRCVTTNSTGSAYLCPDQGHADHYVQFVVRSTGDSGPFVCCRLADRSNFVGIRNIGGTLEVYRRVTGTLSSLHSSAQTIVSGTVLRLECVGTNWEAFKDGVSVASGAIGAAGLTSQRQGLVGRTTASNPWLDDFEAGNLLDEITGTLETAETGDDTFAASGTVMDVITGEMAAAESGDDTFAGEGEVTASQDTPRQPGGGIYPIILVDEKGRPVSRDKLANKAIVTARNAIADLPASERPEARETLQELRSAVKDGHVAAIAEQSSQLATLLQEFEAVVTTIRQLEESARRDAEEDEEDTVAVLLMAG